MAQYTENELMDFFRKFLLDKDALKKSMPEEEYEEKRRQLIERMTPPKER